MWERCRPVKSCPTMTEPLPTVPMGNTELTEDEIEAAAASKKGKRR